MLKRQRPSSPSLPTHFPPESPFNLKHSMNVEDDGPRVKRTRPETTFSGMYDNDGGSEYQSANNALYEIHALNRHRMLFSSKTDSFPSLLTGRRDHEQESKAEQFQEEDDTCDYPPLFTPVEKIHLHLSSRSDTGAESEAEDEKPVESEEARCVQERYEDANRLLGSLAQARLRRRDTYPA